jgi:hypothetical protein
VCDGGNDCEGNDDSYLIYFKMWADWVCIGRHLQHSQL